MSDVGLTVDLMHFEQREGWQTLDVAIVLSVQNVYLAEETLKFEEIVAARFNRLRFANWICIGVPGQTGVKDKPFCDGEGYLETEMDENESFLPKCLFLQANVKYT